MTKQELRRLMREAKRSHSPEERAALSEALCQRIAASGYWGDALTVLLYHALPDEVDLTPLLRLGREQGKRLLLPVVCGDDLEVREYQGEESLHEGAFGIMEPSTGEEGDLLLSVPEGAVVRGEDGNLGSVDLVLVPGMAFDPQGHRLGRGRGYYDRLLPRLTRARRVGVCFPFQLVGEVPTDSHDQCVDEVVRL